MLTHKQNQPTGRTQAGWTTEGLVPLVCESGGTDTAHFALASGAGTIKTQIRGTNTAKACVCTDLCFVTIIPKVYNKERLTTSFEVNYGNHI